MSAEISPTLTLYVIGKTALAMRAIDNLNRLCKGRLEQKYAIDIVDVLDHPQLAEDAQILATPTLVQSSSDRNCRIIGDLANAERVLAILGEVGTAAPAKVSDKVIKLV